MSFDHFRQRAAVVREIALEAVLLCRGAERDPRDRSKWRISRHPQHICISTSGVRANPPWLRARLAAGHQIPQMTRISREKR